MGKILEMIMMFIKIMFAGSGAIVAFFVFCVIVYLAAIVIKSVLQTALQVALEKAEVLTTWLDKETTSLQEKYKNKKKQKGKKKHE